MVFSLISSIENTGGNFLSGGYANVSKCSQRKKCPDTFNVLLTRHMKKPGLAALTHPKPFKPSQEPFVVHEQSDLLRTFRALPLLTSLDSLLNLWPATVQAHLPKVADEASAIDVSPADARKLFENGMGLRFDHAQRHSPELLPWLTGIRQDLGLSELTDSRCLVYASPKGKGNAPHFDQNVNFVLQVHGTKKWWLAPNRHVENPLTRHTMGLPPDPELATYARMPLPTKMPTGAKTYLLQPGSLLFVPRGMWHSTLAQSDALSLNFTFTAPAWLDLLTAALRSRLALSSEWRETAVAPTSAAGLQRFDALLTELTLDLPHWTAANIIGATEG